MHGVTVAEQKAAQSLRQTMQLEVGTGGFTVTKFREYGLSHKTDELKKLIEENPDLPIVVLASDEANCGDWCWQYCFSVSFGLEEILDYDYCEDDDTIFTDRDRLEECISDRLYDEYHNKSKDEYDEAVNRKMAELEPYWTKVIAIYASN